MVENAIQQINSMVSFINTYPLDSDLSGRWHYLPFEQVGPGVCVIQVSRDINNRTPVLI